PAGMRRATLDQYRRQRGAQTNCQKQAMRKAAGGGFRQGGASGNLKSDPGAARDLGVPVAGKRTVVVIYFALARSDFYSRHFPRVFEGLCRSCPAALGGG